MITVGVRLATGPPVNGATRDRKALRCDDARTHGRQAACRAWVSAPFGAPARNPTRRPGRRLKTLPPRYRPTCPKSLASGRVSIASSGAGCRPACGRRPRRRSMKAAPCPGIGFKRWTVIRAHHLAAGAKGGSKTRFWPLERRLYEQEPPHCQRSRIACQGGNDRPPTSKASMPWLTTIRQMPKRFRPTAVTTAITFARQSPDAQAHRSLRERPIVKSQFGSMR